MILKPPELTSMQSTQLMGNSGLQISSGVYYSCEKCNTQVKHGSIVFNIMVKLAELIFCTRYEYVANLIGLASSVIFKESAQ